LQVRSTATDWHDGQISCSQENAVKEIFSVIRARDSEKTNAVIACDRRGAFAQGSNATKQSSLSTQKKILDCFAEPVVGRALARPDGSQ
jgi:hypothetical protein